MADAAERALPNPAWEELAAKFRAEILAGDGKPDDAVSRVFPPT